MCPLAHLREKNKENIYITNKNRNNVVRSFSVDKNVFQQLKKITEGEKTSLNHLVNKILENEVRCYPHKQHGILIVSSRLMKELLSKLDDQEIRQIAKGYGSTIFRELLPSEEKHTYEDFRELLMSFYCEDKSWGKFDYSQEENIISIYHGLGIKWSIFLESFFFEGLTRTINTRMESIIYLKTDNALVIKKT
jgi:predicted DNA-binding ribbon-helix-helix protein